MRFHVASYNFISLITGICNECVSAVKKASLHDWVLRSNVSQLQSNCYGIQLVQGDHFIYFGVLITTFVQVCSLVSYSNLT